MHKQLEEQSIEPIPASDSDQKPDQRMILSTPNC